MEARGSACTRAGALWPAEQRRREGLVLQPWPLAGCAEPCPTPWGAPGLAAARAQPQELEKGRMMSTERCLGQRPRGEPPGALRIPTQAVLNPSKHATGTSPHCWTLHCKGQHEPSRPHRAPALSPPKSSSPALPAFRDFLGHSVRPGHLSPAPRGLWQGLEAAGSAGEGLGGTTREPLFSAAPAPRRHRPGAAGVRQRGLAADPESEPVTQPHRCWLQFRATITY